MPGSGERVEVSTADRSWLVTLDRTLVSLSRESAESAGRVSGRPSDVLLWLWGRAPDSAVEFSGDRDAVRLLREYLAVATE